MEIVRLRSRLRDPSDKPDRQGSTLRRPRASRPASLGSLRGVSVFRGAAKCPFCGGDSLMVSIQTGDIGVSKVKVCKSCRKTVMLKSITGGNYDVGTEQTRPID